MPNVARKQLKRQPDGPETAAAAARLVRPRAARSALAHAAGARARRLSRSGFPRSCCSRRRSRRSSPSTSAFWRAGRRSRRWRRPRSMTSSPPGRGLATTAARATCTNARSSSPSATAVAFPPGRASCCALPGIGPYTAAAIAAIAFGAPATPVDGNIERVVARLFAVQEPLPAAKTELAQPGREP